MSFARNAFGAAALLLVLGAAPAFAQTNIYRSVSVAPGQSARLGVVTALKKDCSIGTLEDVRVVTAPKNGQLAVRKGKVKTPASFRCPNVETPVQALFYQPKANYAGADEVTYESRVTGMPTQTITVKITVDGKAAPAGGKEKKDVLDL